MVNSRRNQRADTQQNIERFGQWDGGWPEAGMKSTAQKGDIYEWQDWQYQSTE